MLNQPLLNQLLPVLMVLAAPVSLNAANTPLGYTACAKQGKVCKFTGSRQVAFGAGGSFTYGIYTGEVDCALDNFGGADPKPNASTKTCSFAPTMIDTSSGQPWFRGVSLAGAEFASDMWGGGQLPGTYGVNYTYPTAAELSYFASQRMNTVRLPFRWERLQPQLNLPLDPAELARLDEVVNAATAQGTHVLLDPHNYARWFSWVVGSDTLPNSAFADFWSRLAAHYQGNPKVIFGLMNEPHDMPTEQWVSAANAALLAIRATGATQLVLVPGNAWSGAHAWSKPWYGTPNAQAMLEVVDPGQNMAIEVHQYLDGDSSGGSTECVSPTIGVERLVEFTTWLRQHGRQAFLGEFGGANTPICQAAITGMLDHLVAHRDVWIGWTWWAAGPWWGDYFLSLDPRPDGSEAPQLSWLKPYLP